MNAMTKKKKEYVSPALDVVEISSAIIAASNTTITTSQYDEYSIEDASWNGLTISKTGSGNMEDALWNNQ